jgi:predicted dehydrogenase
MNIGIIGCGLIGWKRALSIPSSMNIHIVCDTNVSNGKKLAKKIGSSFTNDFSDIINNPDIDIIIISTPNYLIKEIAIKALSSGKHVLSEKPLGKNATESKEMTECASKNNKILYTGFNHRFHPSILKAKELIDSNKIGDILHVHGHYGHGGRPGMEKEWRMEPSLSGGGELLDQGVHLIDLALLFKGIPDKVFGTTGQLVWKSKVEDSASFILLYEDDINFLFSVGWIYWKNKFEFNIYGSNGFLSIHGLGGSYGKEKLTLGIRNIKGGIPEIKNFSFPENDNSWEKEWKFFNELIFKKEYSDNGYQANLIVDAIYKSNKKNQPVDV